VDSACCLVFFLSCCLQKQEAFASFDFAALRAEVASVEAAAAAAHSPTVFAHNDLLSGGWVPGLAAGWNKWHIGTGTPSSHCCYDRFEGAGNIMVPLPEAGSEAPGEAVAAGSSDGAADAAAAGRDGGAAASGQQDGGMTFIDFEYADWAPRGFDWGNHFCE
jgi:thiamine kinase-like enzyme